MTYSNDISLIDIDSQSVDVEARTWTMTIRFPAWLPISQPEDWARDLVRALTRSMIVGTESLALTERKRDELEAELAAGRAEEGRP